MLDIISIAFATIIGLILCISFFAYPLWVFLHHLLLKRLDHLLFIEPYFTKEERLNYLVWPLSYLKSMNYIGLIAVPRIAKRKRFKGFDSPLPVSEKVVILCKIEFALMLAGAMTFIVLVLFMMLTFWLI